MITTSFAPCGRRSGSFHDEAQKAIAGGQTWVKVREATQDIQDELRRMKFELPSEGEEAVSKTVRIWPALRILEGS